MEIDQERETILVVDDELAIRAIVRVVLEQAGYAVATAIDGENGLSVYRSGRSRISDQVARQERRGPKSSTQPTSRRCRLSSGDYRVA
jgi:CheY-like chemotaxis protein